jgi:hypothetical protein
MGLRGRGEEEEVTGRRVQLRIVELSVIPFASALSDADYIEPQMVVEAACRRYI